MAHNEKASPEMQQEKPQQPAKEIIKKCSAAGNRHAASKRGKKEGAGAASADTEATAKTLYRVKFFYEWCKSCGICSALCPKKVILLDDQGNPFVEMQDDCIGCRNCEIHCPDFAITVSKRYPSRRKAHDVSQ